MTREEKLQAVLAKKEYTAADLVTIVELLRLPGGCPWDMEQTHSSIRNDLIEETYEVIEAIDADDPMLLREELGDVLLQVVMHAQMEREAGRATFDEIAGDVCRKMIHRHPHVFGEVVVADSAEVLRNWEKIKSDEKERITVSDKLHAIPRQLPALMRAAKVGKKAALLDFPDTASVLDKVHEELAEVGGAIAAGDAAAIAEELGDLLLSVASLSRFVGVDAERALSDATDKFIARFSAVEEAAHKKGTSLAEMTLEEREKLWQNIKKINKNY